MTTLLIQCQGSPTLSFKVTQVKADAILHHYYNHHRPQNRVVPLMGDDRSIYYINLATVSWICVIEETD